MSSYNKRGGTKRKYGQSNYSSANGVRNQHTQANRPQHGFYGNKQAHIGAPNGLYNARYSASTRGPEKKFNDTYQEQTVPGKGFGTGGPVALLQLLNGIAQGTDYNQRIGRTIQMRSIQINVSMTADSFTGQIAPPTGGFVGAVETLRLVRREQSFSCRLMLIYDRQSNGGQPVIADVLNGSVFGQTFLPLGNYTSIGPQLTTKAFNNLNNKDRFMIIMDKKVTLTSMGGMAGTFTKKFRRIMLETQFTNNVGTVPSIQTGAMWLLVFGEQTDDNRDIANGGIVTDLTPVSALPSAGPLTSNNGLYVHWSTRIRYTDV